MSDEDSCSNGNGKIEIHGYKNLSEVNCCEFFVTGAGSVDRGVISDTTNITGTLVVENSLSAEELSVSGSLRVGGELNAEKATISGDIQVEGAAKIDTLVISGKAKFADIKADQFISRNEISANNICAKEMEVKNP